ncbi:hypothetical protein STSP2_03480 [Anaerohalosphaera lusitana]|uniref:PEP-CTERM protein-sorting domain-containing protein n=1 Tax=Anaerohalosphaera lusitana TaxID=1936003 RepID=A0A1U9NRB0_9BACT|nr:PEP-CTERM sorting domain-containing protein [Anaerohalosphaera lusitana]AQT70274.1 hypothetical protein STSP2_03480 [Anaerohalosphaera lusitana]
MKKSVLISCLLFVFCVVGNSYGLAVVDSDYQLERVAGFNYYYPYGHAKEITFDDASNIYVSHDSGGVLKIDQSGNEQFIGSGFENLQGIVWAGGTRYGDNLYAADVYPKAIKQVSTSGQSGVLVNVPNEPLNLTIDHTGNYGGDMFVGTRRSAEIYRIFSDGSVAEFIDMPYLGDRAFVGNMAFDETGNYGGSMFVAIGNYVLDDYKGVLKIDPDGDVTKFLPDKFGWGDFAFDTDGFFNEQMYASNGSDIYSVDTDGTLTMFMEGHDGIRIRDLKFDQDGSLNVLWTNGDHVFNIDKVSLVPEPCSLVLLGVGAFVMGRRRNRN